MIIRVREDSVQIEGYVNAIERNSKPLMSRIGRFIERICKGAFKKAIKRNDDIHILLNHDWDRDLGSTKQGNLELEEDNIGLRAKATITDKEVVEKARNGELVGWSFGFQDREVENSTERGMPLREVKDLDLFEVSVLDRSKAPAYEGTLVAARSVDGEEQIHFRGEALLDDNVKVEGGKTEAEDGKHSDTDSDTDSDTVNDRDDAGSEEEPANNEEGSKPQTVDYSKYKDMIKDMKEE